MNCKPGDMAIVKRPLTADCGCGTPGVAVRAGVVVTVTRLVPCRRSTDGLAWELAKPISLCATF